MLQYIDSKPMQMNMILECEWFEKCEVNKF